MQKKWSKPQSKTDTFVREGCVVFVFPFVFGERDYVCSIRMHINRST